MACPREIHIMSPRDLNISRIVIATFVRHRMERSITNTPEIRPAVHTLDEAIIGYRQNLGSNPINNLPCIMSKLDQLGREFDKQYDSNSIPSSSQKSGMFWDDQLMSENVNRERYNLILNSIFQGNNVSWENITVMLILASTLSLRSAQQGWIDTCVPVAYVDWTVAYIQHWLWPFIADQGGWSGVASYDSHYTKDLVWTYTKNATLIGAVGLGAFLLVKYITNPN